MQGVKSITVEAVITRADGTVENMGVIARHDGSKIARAIAAVSNFFRSLL